MDRYTQTLMRLPGVDEKVAAELIEAGFYTIKLVNEAPEDELAKIKDLGKAGAKAVKEHLKKLGEKSKSKG